MHALFQGVRSRHHGIEGCLRRTECWAELTATSSSASFAVPGEGVDATPQVLHLHKKLHQTGMDSSSHQCAPCLLHRWNESSASFQASPSACRWSYCLLWISTS